MAHGVQRALAGEHDWGSPGTEPGIVLRSFGSDHATDRHEKSMRKEEQVSLDVLKKGIEDDESRRRKTYPNMPPEPIIYLPRVRNTPLGPAPYWKIITVPLFG